MADTMPELVWSTRPTRRPHDARADSRRRARCADYTRASTPPTWMVHRNQFVLRQLAGDRRAPPTGGVISHRSAFDGRPHEGRLTITRGKTRRDLRLPGLTVHIAPGPVPRLDFPAPDSPFGALYLASDPRRFLENLTRGRGWRARSVTARSPRGRARPHPDCRRPQATDPIARSRARDRYFIGIRSPVQASGPPVRRVARNSPKRST